MHSRPRRTAASTASASSPVGVRLAVTSRSPAGKPAPVRAARICSVWGLLFPDASCASTVWTRAAAAVTAGPGVVDDDGVGDDGPGCDGTWAAGAVPAGSPAPEPPMAGEQPGTAASNSRHAPNAGRSERCPRLVPARLTRQFCHGCRPVLLRRRPPALRPSRRQSPGRRPRSLRRLNRHRSLRRDRRRRRPGVPGLPRPGPAWGRRLPCG